MMRHIPLRSLDDPRGELATVSTAEVIRNVVRAPLDRQRGADIEEIRRGIRILDAVDAANGSVELEDADWDHLCEKARVTTWGLVDKRLLVVIEDIFGA